MHLSMGLLIPWETGEIRECCETLLSKMRILSIGGIDRQIMAKKITARVHVMGGLVALIRK